MKRIAIALACLVSACASTYAANPNDPVDMAAELGNRGRAYVGMGEVCDRAAGGGHRAAIVQAVQAQQERLGVLSGLVNRAYRGRATPQLTAHMQAEMGAHGLTPAQFCGEVVAQAEAELSDRATLVLTLSPQPDLLYYAREIQEPRF
jgi:hypothetical protein